MTDAFNIFVNNLVEFKKYFDSGSNNEKFNDLVQKNYDEIMGKQVKKNGVKKDSPKNSIFLIN